MEIQKRIKEIQSNQSLLNLANHRALNDSIIVIPVEIDEPGITKRSSKFEDRPGTGIVVASGEEVTNLNDGDFVFFGEYSHFKVTHDDISYLIMRAEDIFSVANTN